MSGSAKERLSQMGVCTQDLPAAGSMSEMAMLQPLTEFSVDLVFHVATRVG